jgi:hypothetical protein
MPLPGTGLISLSAIKTEFGGGADPLGLDEYYQDAVPSYTSGVTGIPNKYALISLGMFHGKSKPAAPPSVEYMLYGDATTNMDLSGSTSLGLDGGDDAFMGIGNVGFPFFWFGVDYGTSSNIQWTTNNVMTFGGGSNRYQAWTPDIRPGVLMGQSDRKNTSSGQFAPYLANGHNIKRFMVNQHNYYTGSGGYEIRMEIRLIRGPAYQYIEIRIANWAPGTTNGIWNISNGANFIPSPNGPFTSAPPVTTGESVVLRGDLNGNNWVAFNNHYVNLPSAAPVLASIANLVLWHNGYNIDGSNNSTLSSGTPISSWYNSGSDSSLTTTQSTSSYRPTYTLNGAVFSNGKSLISNINLNLSTYTTMNIFIVWKKTQSSSSNKWLWSQDDSGFDRTLIIISDIGLYIGRGDGNDVSPTKYIFPINSIVIVNCEYNSPGQTGYFFINNTNLVNFSNLAVAGSMTTEFGSNGGGDTSIDGIIHEILIINRILQTTERTDIYNALLAKY